MGIQMRSCSEWNNLERKKEKKCKTCKHTHTHDQFFMEHINMGLINKVDMVCLSPVGYGV